MLDLERIYYPSLKVMRVSESLESANLSINLNIPKTYIAELAANRLFEISI